MPPSFCHPAPFLQLYPADEAVFAEPVAQHRKHLMPLLSLDLARVNPEWQGRLHVVNPYEPHDGMLGDLTGEFHHGYVQRNWLAFRVDHDSRYHWLGDWRFFLLEDAAAAEDELRQRARRELARHYQRTEQAYQARRAEFAAHGYLPDAYSGEPLPLLDQLGGTAAFDNWASGGLNQPLPVDISDREDVYPLSPAGERFQFVCSVDASHYGDYGAQIQLFYLPEQRIALLTFNWS